MPDARLDPPTVPIPILMYHSISSSASPRYRPFALPRGRFAEHMSLLDAEGYTSLTVSELIAQRGKSTLPPRPVLITFDDGFFDFHTDALPVLQEHHLSSTLYVVSGHVGGTSSWMAHEGEGDRRMLSWEQLREAAASGVEIGAHSHTHPQLDVLPLKLAREEILISKSILEDRLGHGVQSFAYPHGYHGPAVRRLVHESGYTSACAVRYAMSSTHDDAFALARIGVAADTTVPQLRAWLDGIGLRPAQRGERLTTRGWRLFRRGRARLSSVLTARSTPAATWPCDPAIPSGIPLAPSAHPGRLTSAFWARFSG